jgi:hypothetical protein
MTRLTLSPSEIQDGSEPAKENNRPPAPPPPNQPNDAGRSQQDSMRDIKVGFKFESADYKYRMDELIGNGGYGRVFEATAQSKTNPKETKRVAVKIEPRTTSTAIEVQVLQAARDRSSHRFPLIQDNVGLIFLCSTGLLKSG